MNPRFLLMTILLLMTSLTICPAQPSDTVVPNPNAVKLQRLWMIRGGDVNSSDWVGLGSGSLNDINGDGLGDFAILTGKTGQWKVFLGAPQIDTQAVWAFDSADGDLLRPVTGDFWNRGHQAFGFLSFRRGDPNNSSDIYSRLYLYQPTNGTIPDSPEVVWDPGLTTTPPVQLYSNNIFGTNLDDVPGDELVAVCPVLSRTKVRSTIAEIWIYRGGADFQVDTPTVVIRDDEENDDRAFSVAVADFDGDGFKDLITGCAYKSGPKLKIWFGRDGSPWNWTSPDRVIDLTPDVGVNTRLTVGDYDGDGIPDLAGTLYTQPDPGIYVYLSRSAKDFRTRSFFRNDADRILRTSTFRTWGNVGFLNDHRRQYEMLGIINPGFDRFDPSELVVFSGGPTGPNPTYEAHYRTSGDGLVDGKTFQNMSPLLDCNGDGWDDLLVSDPQWWGYNQGIAIVLSGGPMIPQDFPPSAVETVASQDKSDALKLWPVPAHDKLNIYWRGDLSKMPTRFSIYDITGQRIASGDVESSSGAALWNCSDVPPGTYLLTAFDEHNEIITTTTFIKE